MKPLDPSNSLPGCRLLSSRPTSGHETPPWTSCWTRLHRGLRVGAGSPSACNPAATAEPPSLVVLVVLDQFRADYLTRFGPQLKGGLARLMRDGAWFTNAHHDHAIAETAPGHATLLSGRFPRSTGIGANRIGVEDPAFPMIEGAAGAGASPARFRGTTLVDWLRAGNARSRALSVSRRTAAPSFPWDCPSRRCTGTRVTDGSSRAATT